MSFRELRNFSEIMESLGYPRQISIESFRAPNFKLVADCLHWLISRYDPSADLLYDVTSEADRVFFLKSATQTMLTKGRIKLNLKKLYAADGYAVRELLKIASVLYKALNMPEEEENEAENELTFSTSKSLDVKQTRQLVTEITQRGAALYDALDKEPQLRDARQAAIARNMDMDAIERAVRQAVQAVQENILGADRMLEGLRTDEDHLRTKIDKRRAELERSEKRLSTLQSVRPAYMDEYEKLQGDLQGLFTTYMEKFRNLEWLEGQLEAHNRKEQERMDESERALKRMQRRIKDEEQRILRGEQSVDESKADADDSDEEADSSRAASSQRSRSAARTPASRQSAGGSGRRAEMQSKGAFVGQRPGLSSGASSRGGTAVGRDPEDDESDLSDEDVRDVDGGEDSESTHLTLNGDESSGDDLIADDDEDFSEDEGGSEEEDEEENPSDNDF
ncbi:hypothetical protein KFL_009780010 [Klebsormidium nitens]|uniref:Clusterin-associated protein 1 n=1 Tax=Klebsormidium nitens TaxID=105231 RepID=A0A1Y1IUG9_KLENI|nr:hypothetical protein KFL_009780010 [Klebsormidium nitens]|eukprot:GAQ92317.1 hypothetical protein KFL_009780010 [Klebsormidium nitens]